MDKKQFSRRMVFGCCIGMLVCLAAAWSQQLQVVTEKPILHGDTAFEIVTTPDVGQALEPQFNEIQRTQFIMSLIRGEFEGTDSDGSGFIEPDEWEDLNGNGRYDLQLMSLTDVNRWAEAFYVAYGELTYPEGHPQAGEKIPWANLTPVQRGLRYLFLQRRHHVEVRRGSDVPIAIDAARATAEAEVDTAAEIFPEIEE